MAEFYDHTDLLVMPTFYEGYGMVVAEALARGIPVVGTRTGAIPDLVGADAGLLVPPGDEAALAEALRSVLDDPSLRARLQAGAREARGRLPTWDRSAAALAEALQRLAASGAARWNRLASNGWRCGRPPTTPPALSGWSRSPRPRCREPPP